MLCKDREETKCEQDHGEVQLATYDSTVHKSTVIVSCEDPYFLHENLLEYFDKMAIKF